VFIFNVIPPNQHLHEHSTQKRNCKGKRQQTACVETSDLSADTKKHTTKFRETVPLINTCGASRICATLALCSFQIHISEHIELCLVS
jgi:hypothetical protein